MSDAPPFWGPPGDRVPVVSPADIKIVWEIQRDVEQRNPGQQVAIGAEFIRASCSPGADIRAVSYRATMVRMLLHVAPDQFASWRVGDNSAPAVLEVAATIPMTWIGQEPSQGFPFDVEAFIAQLPHP